MEFELRLVGGEVVTWEGKDGVEACHRYVDAHREAEVIAWRDIPHGLFLGLRPIVEPNPQGGE